MYTEGQYGRTTQVLSMKTLVCGWQGNRGYVGYLPFGAMWRLHVREGNKQKVVSLQLY